MVFLLMQYPKLLLLVLAPGIEGSVSRNRKRRALPSVKRYNLLLGEHLDFCGQMALPLILSVPELTILVGSPGKDFVAIVQG